ncbi:MAG: glycosyltransferase [Flavobacteriales bacterium]|nr:glycosyltransferase [Flavobacteriales bacterium]
MKKKIVIICNDFPPYNSIGAERPASWCRHVDSEKFEVHVFCRKWKEKLTAPEDYFVNPQNKDQIKVYGKALVHYCNFKPNLRDRIILRKSASPLLKLIQKSLTFFYYIFPYFIRRLDSTRDILYEARAFLEQNPDVFMIIATGEPFIVFRYAYLLHKETGIPWAADYRDGWSCNSAVPHMNIIQKILLLGVLRRLEKKMVRSASLVITVTPALKKQLEEFLGKKVEVVYNGFEELEFLGFVPRLNEKSETFIIGYLGSLYPFQPLEDFVRFFENCTRAQKIPAQKVVFRFIGGKAFSERIKKAFKNTSFGLEILPRIPRQEALIEASSSHVLLFLANGTLDGSAAKLYEYIALKRPIFIFREDRGTVKEILEAVQTGFMFSDENTSCQFWTQLFQAWKNGQQEAFMTRPVNYDSFSRENQAKKFYEYILEYGRS